METEKLIEKLSQEQNESSKVIRVALAYAKFASLVKRMRDTQQDIEMMERFAHKWTVDDYFKYDVFLKDKAKQESEVDEYLKKMEE